MNTSIKSKVWKIAAIGVVLLPVGIAQAHVVKRIENQFITKTLVDVVSGGGALTAQLVNDPGYSALWIMTATSGLYNSRLSTRCSDGYLIESPYFSVSGTAGSVFHVCGGSGTFPLRIEGAIDDL